MLKRIVATSPNESPATKVAFSKEVRHSGYRGVGRLRQPYAVREDEILGSLVSAVRGTVKRAEYA